MQYKWYSCRSVGQVGVIFFNVCMSCRWYVAMCVGLVGGMMECVFVMYVVRWNVRTGLDGRFKNVYVMW